MKISQGRLGHHITHEVYNPDLSSVGNQKDIYQPTNKFKHRGSGVEEFKAP